MNAPGEGKQEALKIFRGLAASYDSVLQYCTLFQDRRWKMWAVRSLALEEGSEVLDVGFGTGVLEDTLRKDCTVVGLDLTDQMLRVAKASRPGASANLVQADAESLPIRDGSFDALVSCYVVKYCEPALFASEASRVLRRGGRLVLYDFVRPRGFLWPLNAAYAYAGLPLMGRVRRAQKMPDAYTFEELPRILAASRWEEDLPAELVRNGFARVGAELLSGGASLGLVATRA